MTAAWLAGLALGAVGSGHCVLMCGPLVLTIGRGARRPFEHAVLYHAGRIATYAVFGVAAGQAGYGLTLAGLGRPLAIVAGVALLLTAVGRLASSRLRLLQRWTMIAARACSAAGRWSRQHPVTGPAVAGAANGLLPCGLVYAALTAAAALASPGASMMFMAAFGLGTVPSLAVLALSASRAPRLSRTLVHTATPIVLTAIGGLLIVRGIGAMPMLVSACHGHFR